MSDIITQKSEELIKKYSKNKSAIKINFRRFVRSKLNVKRSDVYTHNIHSYPGRLFPYIPIFFLSSEKYCPANGKVLDPFSGSGTVLLESIVNPFYKRDVFGLEINPLGRLISKVKTTPIKPHELDGKIKALFKLITASKRNARPVRSTPDFKNIDLWFSESAKNGLGLVKACIEQLKDDDCKDFLWVCFSRLVRSVSKADPNIPPPVILKLYKYEDSYRYEKLKKLIKRNEQPDIEALFEEIVDANAERIKRLWAINDIKSNKVKACIVGDDSREIKKGKCSYKGTINNVGAKRISNSISLIITSPPYLAAQKYVRSTKLELLWLGLTSEDELSVLQKKTIGTENISLKTKKEKIGLSIIDNLLVKIEKTSKERMHVAYDYFKNMSQVLNQCYRALKADGYMVLVVGNNTIGRLTVDTSQILTDLSKKLGFKVIYVLRDEIKDRGMITKRHGTGGLIKDEYVILLQKKTR